MRFVLVGCGALWLWSAAACEDESESASTATSAAATTSVGATSSAEAPSTTRSECEAFCEHSNRCAREAGRRLPTAAQNCAESCGADGLYAATPPAVFGCREAACGEPFQRCTMAGMMAHMRESEVGVFPPSCEGLCHKAARCAERTGRPEPEGTGDCQASCRSGVYADVQDREFLCVHAECGEPFDRCRADQGPPEGAFELPSP